MIPSPRFHSRLDLFDQVFQSGVAPYRQTAVLDVYRLVTGRQLDEIKPYLGTDSPYRGTYSGASGLFTTDKSGIMSAEVLGAVGCANAPSPSFVLHYRFSGDAVFLDHIRHGGFQHQFTQATGLAKYEFSQDCRYYLESRGKISGIQALTWISPSGAALGITGHSYLILPPFSGALKYQNCERVA